MSQPFTLTSAVLLFEAIEHAMEAAGGGKYRAFNLVTELKELGLEVRAIEMPPLVPRLALAAPEAEPVPQAAAA